MSEPLIDRWQGIAGISAIAMSTASGFLGLFTEYRDKASGNITRSGRVAALGIGIGAAIAVSSNFLETARKFEERQDIANNAKSQASSVNDQIDRLKSVNKTLLAIQSDSQNLKSGLSESLLDQKRVMGRTREELMATERVNNDIRHFADRLDPGRLLATLNIRCLGSILTEVSPKLPPSAISEVRINTIKSPQSDNSIPLNETRETVLDAFKKPIHDPVTVFYSTAVGVPINEIASFYSIDMPSELTRFYSSNYKTSQRNAIITFADFVSQNQPHQLDSISGWPGSMIVIEFKLMPEDIRDNVDFERNILPSNLIYKIDEKTDGTLCSTKITLNVGGQIIKSNSGVLAIRNPGMVPLQGGGKVRLNSYLFTRVVAVVPKTFYVDKEIVAKEIAGRK